MLIIRATLFISPRKRLARRCRPQEEKSCSKDVDLRPMLATQFDGDHLGSCPDDGGRRLSTILCLDLHVQLIQLSINFEYTKNNSTLSTQKII
jgi:hypothetical protein